MASSLVRAKELFDIARGTKSGQDDFFYSNDPGFVDPEFRLDLLKNLRDVDSFVLKLNGYSFFCDKSESYLAEMASKKLWTTCEVLTRLMILVEDTDLIGTLFREAHHFRLLPA